MLRPFVATVIPWKVEVLPPVLSEGSPNTVFAELGVPMCSLANSRFLWKGVKFDCVEPLTSSSSTGDDGHVVADRLLGETETSPETT